MFEIRQDYLTGTKVFMSDERVKRPILFKPAGGHGETDTACPFCHENRQLLDEVRYEHESGRVYIVANKYPVVNPETSAHEIVVDTDRHDEAFVEFTVVHMALSLQVIAMRVKALKEKKQHKYIAVFKNDGAGSGASIPHSHWQIIAMPFVPEKQAVIRKNAGKYFKAHGKSYIESIYGKRRNIVWENEAAFAYMPEASLYDYTVHIAPKRQIGTLEGLNIQETEGMAAVLKAVLFGLGMELGRFPFNICFQQGAYASGHFYMEIVPRLGGFAGMEIGSGVYVNGRLPESCSPILADQIRKGGF